MPVWHSVNDIGSDLVLLILRQRFPAQVPTSRPLFGDTTDGYVVFRAQARKACEPKNSGDVFDFVGFGTVNASDDVGHDGFGNKEALHLVALDGLQEFKRLLIFDALRAN